MTCENENCSTIAALLLTLGYKKGPKSVKNSINQEWKGLGINLAGNQRYSLIDDAPSHGFWFSAIGAFRYWGGKNTIPGPRIEPHRSKSPTTRVELFVLSS